MGSQPRSNLARSDNAGPRLAAAHAAMVEMLVAGGGIDELARLAVRELGGTVAILCPDHAVVAVAPAAEPRRLSTLEAYAEQRLAGFPVTVPEDLTAQRFVQWSGAEVGVVLHIGEPGPAVGHVLEAAALATTTALTLDARPQGGPAARDMLVRDLAAGRLDPAEISERARGARLDLAGGAIAVAVRPAPGRSGQANRVRALIEDESTGAAVAAHDGDVLALVPGVDATAAPRIAASLGRLGPVALAPLERDVGRLDRALREARILLVLVADGELAPGIQRAGPHQVLARLAAEDRASVSTIADETVRPLDDAEATRGVDLLGTLSAYIDSGGRMNATAAKIPAHRHTVGYRLTRIRELTGLDVAVIADRERLTLGMQALLVERATAELPVVHGYQI